MAVVLTTLEAVGALFARAPCASGEQGPRYCQPAVAPGSDWQRAKAVGILQWWPYGDYGDLGAAAGAHAPVLVF